MTALFEVYGDSHRPACSVDPKMPKPSLHAVPETPKPVDYAGDIYASTRQLWRDDDRWSRMWINADKARAFSVGGRG